MSKHEILTDEHMAGFRLNPVLRELIEERRRVLSVDAAQMRVLDYGCGRGRSVAALRELGHAAFGVDVDPEPIANGKPYFRDRGLDGDHLLRAIGESGKTDFEDGYFHFVFSEQVFEHVRDIDLVSEEIGRVTGTRGGGYHVFSAPRHVVEEHLHLPFVHWLPKNGLRRAWITTCLLLGRDPGWPELEGKGILTRARHYWAYSVEKTHYRKWRQVAMAFEKHGFTVAPRFGVIGRPGGMHGVMLSCFRRVSERLYRTMCLETVTIPLDMQKYR